MTIDKAIMEAGALRPDSFTDEQKFCWINELEGKIALETMHMESFTPYDFPKDKSKELMLIPPYDNVYPLYILAMGDLFSGDIQSYAQSAAVFSQNYSEMKKQYIRTHMPPSQNYRIEV